MKVNRIHLWHGDRKLSIVQGFDKDGVILLQEILDITDGFGGDPIPFNDTVESFNQALRKSMINSCLEKISKSDVT